LYLIIFTVYLGTQTPDAFVVLDYIYGIFGYANSGICKYMYVWNV